MNQPKISWNRIAQAINYYTIKKYEYIEVPWMVDEETINITKPPQARLFDSFLGNLVASGEQSFLAIREDLCPGRKYQCVTPCFRDEKYDELHLPYFVKCELIHVLWKTDDADQALELMIRDAWNFITGITYTCTEVVKTDIGKDILTAGIEVGSYGYREHEGFRWIYGTGLAEPRMSQAVSKWEKDSNEELEQLMR